jgi:hypothetical protein
VAVESVQLARTELSSVCASADALAHPYQCKWVQGWAAVAALLGILAAGGFVIARRRRDRSNADSSLLEEDVQDWPSAAQSAQIGKADSEHASVKANDALSTNGRVSAVGTAQPPEGSNRSEAEGVVRSANDRQASLVANQLKSVHVPNMASAQQERQAAKQHSGAGATAASGRFLESQYGGSRATSRMAQDSAPETSHSSQSTGQVQTSGLNPALHINFASVTSRQSGAEVQMAAAGIKQASTDNAHLQPVLGSVPLPESGQAATLPHVAESGGLPPWTVPQTDPSQTASTSPQLTPQMPYTSPLQPVPSRPSQQVAQQSVAFQLPSEQAQQHAAFQHPPSSIAAPSSAPGAVPQNLFQASAGSQNSSLAPASSAQPQLHDASSATTEEHKLEPPGYPATPPPSATVSNFEQMKSFWLEQQASPFPSPQADIAERTLSRHASSDSAISQAYLAGRNTSNSGTLAATEVSKKTGGSRVQHSERESLNGSLVSATSGLASPQTLSLGPADLADPSPTLGYTLDTYQTPSTNGKLGASALRARGTEPSQKEAAPPLSAAYSQAAAPSGSRVDPLQLAHGSISGTAMPAMHGSTALLSGPAATAAQAPVFPVLGVSSMPATRGDDLPRWRQDKAPTRHTFVPDQGALNSAAKLGQGPFEPPSGSSGSDMHPAEAAIDQMGLQEAGALRVAVGGGKKPANGGEPEDDDIHSADSMQSGSPTYFSYPMHFSVTQRAEDAHGTLAQQGHS